MRFFFLSLIGGSCDFVSERGVRETEGCILVIESDKTINYDLWLMIHNSQ